MSFFLFSRSSVGARSFLCFCNCLNGFLGSMEPDRASALMRLCRSQTALLTEEFVRALPLNAFDALEEHLRCVQRILDEQACCVRDGVSLPASADSEALLERMETPAGLSNVVNQPGADSERSASGRAPALNESLPQSEPDEESETKETTESSDSEPNLEEGSPAEDRRRTSPRSSPAGLRKRKRSGGGSEGVVLPPSSRVSRKQLFFDTVSAKVKESPPDSLLSLQIRVCTDFSGVKTLKDATEVCERLKADEERVGAMSAVVYWQQGLLYTHLQENHVSLGFVSAGELWRNLGIDRRTAGNQIRFARAMERFPRIMRLNLTYSFLRENLVFFNQLENERADLCLLLKDVPANLENPAPTVTPTVAMHRRKSVAPKRLVLGL